MSLLQRLSDELRTAMLAKDANRLSTLRLLKSAIGYAQIERKNENLSDAEIIWRFSVFVPTDETS